MYGGPVVHTAVVMKSLAFYFMLRVSTDVSQKHVPAISRDEE
jgi:hypothetical protein